MKKIGILLAAVLLLCGCSEKTPPQDYCNTVESCFLGTTQYHSNLGGLDILLWNPAWDEWQEGLCRDPLCTHDNSDSLCPSSINLSSRTVVTDGYKLYINASNPSGGLMNRQIFSLNPDGSDFKLLHTYGSTDNSYQFLQYADGYLYFQEGYYNDNYIPGSEEITLDVQSQRVMRIPVDGGKAEEVLDFSLPIGCVLYPDGENYYLITYDDQGVSQLDMVDVKTKAVTENILPEARGKYFDITLYDGKTWITASDALYVRENGSFRLICDGKNRYSFGDGIWCTENAEREYIGTKELPTGAPNGESAPRDFYIHPTQKISRIDTDTYSITDFIPSDDFDADDTITVDYVTAAGMRVLVTNERNMYNGGKQSYSCLIRCENGTITIEKVYE